MNQYCNEGQKGVSSLQNQVCKDLLFLIKPNIIHNYVPYIYRYLNNYNIFIFSISYVYQCKFRFCYKISLTFIELSSGLWFADLMCLQYSYHWYTHYLFLVCSLKDQSPLQESVEFTTIPIILMPTLQRHKVITIAISWFSTTKEYSWIEETSSLGFRSDKLPLEPYSGLYLIIHVRVQWGTTLSIRKINTK